MTPTVKPHYLRPNHREASPHRVLVFDTETQPHHVGGEILQTLACWATRLVLRHESAGNNVDAATAEGTTADALADVLEAAATESATLWVFAHNLGFDLAVTRLPVLLIERGWTLTMHALASDAPWARFRKGKTRITMTNSASYLPVSVAALAPLVGQTKQPLPPADDLPGLLERCRSDVEITTAALIELMDWWDDSALGNWSLTGPGTGWSAYRHQPSMVNVLINPDPDALAFERRALLAGRREAWRVGELPRGYYLDLDIEHAHLSAAASMPLPYQRMTRFDSLPLDSQYLTLQSLDVLAECEIETETPRYPVQLPHGLFYPVGRFRTVLAGPEIREAAARGELRAIGEGYVYRVGAHMARWGRWLVDCMSSEENPASDVVRVAVKGWSRSVPGRWASHTSEVIAEYPDVRPGWHLEHGTWMPERWPVSYLTVAGTQYVLRRDVEGENSFPAVLAWIQSYTRVWLGRIVDLAGPAAVQCNTDGMIVDAARLASYHGIQRRGPVPKAATAERQLSEVLTALNEAIAPARVRVKHTSQTVRVIGAQHVVLDHERRLSGVPREATEIADLKFRYWSWPSLQGQLLRGDSAGFRQQQLEADLSHVPLNRWVLADGTTRPVRLTIAADGSNAVEPWRTWEHAPGTLDLDHALHQDLTVISEQSPALL